MSMETVYGLVGGGIGIVLLCSGWWLVLCEEEEEEEMEVEQSNEHGFGMYARSRHNKLDRQMGALWKILKLYQHIKVTQNTKIDFLYDVSWPLDNTVHMIVSSLIQTLTIVHCTHNLLSSIGPYARRLLSDTAHTMQYILSSILNYGIL